MERTCKFCAHKDTPIVLEPCLSCFEAKCSENVVSPGTSIISVIVVSNNFEPIRSCGTCKYIKESICSDVCDTCRIEFGLPNWEEKDE